jgi:hypothetical protein
MFHPFLLRCSLVLPYSLLDTTVDSLTVEGHRNWGDDVRANLLTGGSVTLLGVYFQKRCQSLPESVSPTSQIQGA